MSVSLHTVAVDTCLPMLRVLSGLLDKAVAHAGDKAPELLGARLAPDMLPLARQVKLVCHQVLLLAARLRGEEPPVNGGDDDTSFEAMKERIAGAIAVIEGVPEATFAEAEARTIAFPLIADMSVAMTGAQYVQHWILPNFYFHLVTAYDILRNQGVPLGKGDYMAHLGPYIRRG
jgi:hypothetical protein